MKKIYFDHAATSYPKSTSVSRAVTKSMALYGGNPGRSSHALALASGDMLFDAREKISDFLSYDRPDHVVLTSGATMALNLAIHQYIKPFGHVLLSNLEHNAVFRPIHLLCEKYNATYSTFSYLDASLDLEKKLQDNTCLVVCTHASNLSGRLLPISTLGAICKSRNIPFIIDASQSIGHLPFSFEETHASILCAPFHKALGGVMGGGFALFREDDATPFIAGGSGSNSLSPYMPKELPDCLEAGTPPTVAIASVLASLEELSLEKLVRRKNAMLLKTDYAIQKLNNRSDVMLYDAHPNPCGIIAFNLASVPSSEVGNKLDRHGICVRSGFHCTPLAHQTLNTGEFGAVRISFGEENTLSEIDYMMKVLDKEFPS